MAQRVSMQLLVFTKLVAVVAVVEQTQLVMAAQVAQEHWFLAVAAVVHRKTAILVRVALEETDL
jgi:hypothetical protein